MANRANRGRRTRPPGRRRRTRFGCASSLERKETNEAAMSLEINQIKLESDFVYCRFRGARKGHQGLLHGLWGRGPFGRGAAGEGAGRNGAIPAQPGLQLSHDVL